MREDKILAKQKREEEVREQGLKLNYTFKPPPVPIGDDEGLDIDVEDDVSTDEAEETASDEEDSEDERSRKEKAAAVDVRVGRSIKATMIGASPGARRHVKQVRAAAVSSERAEGVCGSKRLMRSSLTPFKRLILCIASHSTSGSTRPNASPSNAPRATRRSGAQGQGCLQPEGTGPRACMPRRSRGEATNTTSSRFTTMQGAVASMVTAAAQIQGIGRARF